jgi:hypothetical protein
MAEQKAVHVIGQLILLLPFTISFIIYPDFWVSRKYASSEFIYILGVILTAFCSISIVYLFWKIKQEQ